MLKKLRKGPWKVRLCGLGTSILILLIVAISFNSYANAQDEVIVTSIEVKPSKYVSREELKALITSTVIGQPLDEQKVLADLWAIYAYGERPDGRVLFEDVQVDFVEESKGVKVVFTPIDHETPVQLPIINGFVIDIDVLDEKWVLDRLSVKPGEPLTTANVQKLGDDIDKIITAAQDEEGYSIVLTPTGLTFDDQQNVHIQLRATRIASISVKGNEKTKTYVIEREIFSKVGDPINSNDIIGDMSRIFRLGFFDDVIPSFTYTEDPLWVDVMYEVVEKKTAELNFGLGIGSTGLSGFVQFEEKNLFGTGRLGKLYLEKSGVASNYGLEFYDPRINNSFVSGGFSIYKGNESDKENNENSSTVGGSVSIGHRFSDLLKAEAKLRIDNTTVTKENEPEKDDKLRTVGLGLTGDNTNHIFNPTTGWKYNLNLELATGLFGGNIKYNKINGQISKYQSVGKNGQVVAMRLMGGTISNDVADNYLYRIGGHETLRTYGSIEDKSVGDKMLLSNVEYRFPINDTFQGVIFLDAGAAWDSKEEINLLEQIKSSIGVEVRVQSPIGPIRLGYGLLGGDEKLIFSLGSMF